MGIREEVGTGEREWNSEVWQEWRERAGRDRMGSRWEEERRDFFGSRGWGLEEVERGREGEEKWVGQIVKVDVEMQRMERWRRIKESRYDRWYKEVREKGIPDYLKKSGGK